MEKELLGQNIKKLYYNISILYMSESNKFKPVNEKVDCNAPRTSPFFSWALCGASGRKSMGDEKPNMKTIKTSPITVPKKKGKGGRKKSRKRKKKKRTKKRKGGKKRRKTRRKKKTRRRRRK